MNFLMVKLVLEKAEEPEMTRRGARVEAGLVEAPGLGFPGRTDKAAGRAGGEWGSPVSPVVAVLDSGAWWATFHGVAKTRT